MSQTQTTLLLMVNADYNHVQGHIFKQRLLLIQECIYHLAFISDYLKYIEEKNKTLWKI